MDYHEFYTLWRKCTHYFDDESLWWTRLHKLDIYKEKDLVSYWERMQSLSDNKKFIHFLLSKQIPNEVDDNLSSIELYIVDYLCDYTITSKNKQWSHINISTTALSHLRSAIISQIDKIIQEVIRFEYDVYTSAYSNCSYSYFLNHITRESEWIEYMAESYPVLFSDLNNFVVNYKNLVDEFWQRLKIDYLDICHKFSIPQSVFKIIDLNLFCGDMHRNGCNTIRISFTDDKKEVYTFYYKPKPLASDCVWNAILKQLYNIGLKQTSLLTTNIDKISYGWQKDANCTKEIDGNHIKSLCFNQGVNVGLAYIFGIQDLIADNVLLKNDMPIFFDMEMLFTPTLKMENDYYIASNVSQHYLQGVIKTGLIPCFGFETLNHIGYDNSGLSVGIGRKQQVSYDSFFTEDLLRGFDYICGFVKKHKKEIVGILREEVDKCDHLQMRYLIRFTFNYSQLFKFLYSPDCQSDVCKRHLAIENLWLGFDKKILNEDIIQDEIRQISHGDIPLFSCRPYSRHLYNEKGEIVVHDYFQTDGINACIERITNLSDVDILFQKDVISRSLFIHGYTKETDVLLPLLKDFEKSTISPIEQIANVLYGLPMGFDDNKYFTYIDYVISKDDMWSQGVQNLDMFQGVAGVGVFFMAWYRYSQDVRAKEIAIKIFNESLEYLQLNRISLFDSPIAKFGVMTYPCSIIYYYILGRKILGADCLQLRDNDLLLILDYIESKYHKDTHLDYFSGITGLVLLLIELNTMLPNERISKTVHLLGEYLYSSAEPIGDNRFHGISLLLECGAVGLMVTLL